MPQGLVLMVTNQDRSDNPTLIRFYLHKPSQDPIRMDKLDHQVPQPKDHLALINKILYLLGLLHLLKTELSSVSLLKYNSLF
jgi:hypothetical protein